MPGIRAKRTKESIVRAAERCFATKGFQGTTMEYIADEAGINKALPYNYFKNKQHLYTVVTRNCLSRQMACLPCDLPGPPQEQVRLILGSLLQSFCQMPLCAQIQRWELADGSCLHLTNPVDDRPSVLDQLCRVIEDGVCDGSFRRDLAVREVALHLLVLAQSFFICRETFEQLGMSLETIRRPATVERVTNYCLRLLLP